MEVADDHIAHYTAMAKEFDRIGRKSNIDIVYVSYLIRIWREIHSASQDHLSHTHTILTNLQLDEMICAHIEAVDWFDFIHGADTPAEVGHCDICGDEDDNDHYYCQVCGSCYDHDDECPLH